MLNIAVTILNKILKNFFAAKVYEIDQIFVNFFKDGIPAIAIYFPNIVNQ